MFPWWLFVYRWWKPLQQYEQEAKWNSHKNNVISLPASGHTTWLTPRQLSQENKTQETGSCHKKTKHRKQSDKSSMIFCLPQVIPHGWHPGSHHRKTKHRKQSDKNNVISLSASGHTTRLTPGQLSASHSWCVAPCSLWVSTLARSCYRWPLFHTSGAQCQVSEKSLEMCICLWPEFDCPEVTLCGWQDVKIHLLLLLCC